jgi:hypothetical protein
MADTITTARPDGTLYTFGVTPCNANCAAGSFELRHAAIAANGGAVILAMRIRP